MTQESKEPELEVNRGGEDRSGLPAVPRLSYQLCSNAAQKLRMEK